MRKNIIDSVLNICILVGLLIMVFIWGSTFAFIVPQLSPKAILISELQSPNDFIEVTPVEDIQDNQLNEREQKVVAILTKIEKSSVEIMAIGSGGMNRCTGVVYQNNEEDAIVITAKHCISPTEEMYVENNLVINVDVSNTDDLALLYVYGHIPNKEPVIIANNNAKAYSIIFMIGFPNGDPYIKFGQVKQTTQDWQFARIQVIGGCSGGGFYNEKAELIGIVWGGYQSEDTAIFEPISDVKKFLNQKRLL